MYRKYRHIKLISYCYLNFKGMINNFKCILKVKCIVIAENSMYYKTNIVSIDFWWIFKAYNVTIFFFSSIIKYSNKWSCHKHNIVIGFL